MWEYQISGPQEENEPAKDQERERERAVKIFPEMVLEHHPKH